MMAQEYAEPSSPAGPSGLKRRVRRLLEGLGIQWPLSLNFFGNSISLRINLLNAVHHFLASFFRRLRGKAAVPDPSVAAASAELRSQGCVATGYAGPAEDVEAIARKVDRLLAEPDRVSRGSGGEEPLLRLRNSLEVVPEIERLITPRLLGILEGYFGSGVKLFSSDIYRTTPATQALRDSWLWHLDNCPKQMVKVMVYLTDSREETGALRVIPRPLSASLIRKGFWRRTEADRFLPVLDDRRNWRVLEGLPGTTLVFSTHHCIHKATAPLRGHRDVVVFLFQPALHSFERHLGRLRGRISRNRGYCVNPFTDAALRIGDE